MVKYGTNGQGWVDITGLPIEIGDTIVILERYGLPIYKVSGFTNYYIKTTYDAKIKYLTNDHNGICKYPVGIIILRKNNGQNILTSLQGVDNIKEHCEHIVYGRL